MRMIELVGLLVDEPMNNNSWASYIEHNLLATALGVCVTKDKVFTFRCGDGELIEFVCGTKAFDTPTFVNNAPVYLGYCILPMLEKRLGPQHDKYMLKLGMVYPLADWQGTIIATDGARDIVPPRCYPGTERSIGHLHEMFSNEQMWKNPDTLNRTLRLMNTDKTIAGKRYTGVLADDTTIVMVKPAFAHLYQMKETGRWSSTNPPLANVGKTREESDES